MSCILLRYTTVVQTQQYPFSEYPTPKRHLPSSKTPHQITARDHNFQPKFVQTVEIKPYAPKVYSSLKQHNKSVRNLYTHRIFNSVIMNPVFGNEAKANVNWSPVCTKTKELFLNNTVVNQMVLKDGFYSDVFDLEKNISMIYNSTGQKSTARMDKQITTANPENDVKTITLIASPQKTPSQPVSDVPSPLADYLSSLYGGDTIFLTSRDPLHYLVNLPPYSPFPRDQTQLPTRYYSTIFPPSTPRYESLAAIYEKHTIPDTATKAQFTEPTTIRIPKSSMELQLKDIYRTSTLIPSITKTSISKFIKRNSYYPTYTQRTYFHPSLYTTGYSLDPLTTSQEQTFVPSSTKKSPVPPPTRPPSVNTHQEAAFEMPKFKNNLLYHKLNSVTSVRPTWTPSKSSVEVNGTPSDIDPKYKLAVVSNYQNYNESSGKFGFDIDLENGLTVQVRGFMKKGKQVLNGSFTLFTNDGEPVRINFTADNEENSDTNPVVNGDAVPANITNPEI